ncbi:glycosyl hydrolase [Niabella ginsenosidivorans]|uniref:Glycosyl hydrolase n=1 Tax=Niabella ginsenosidivorans TaxID=1176587 RepID=A0A1A9IAE8_9BACT|nr:glycoside hydrolase family 2 TIM barrel-domain containing protein [Niabella ginsenosidivorans]ANH84019.1 glycosyl hydrolase [Niabella ginsenosidivorans]
MMIKHIAITVLFLAVCLSYCRAQYPSARSYELNSGWKCHKASGLSVKPETLSESRYSIASWMPATVPGTVLTTLLENKKIPDPFYGMNNNRIPDIAQAGKAYYTYWFCKDFKEAPPEDNGQVWLNFRGINYRCAVYLNGKKVNKEPFTGMFLRQRYNVTRYLEPSGQNRLAVIVYPPDEVGDPNGGQGGDGTIAKNVAHQYVAGWDWIQPVRDRNTGIWDKVTIEKTGAVIITDPFIKTTVPGIRKPGEQQEPAFVHASATLENAGNTAVTGVLRYVVNEQYVTQRVQLQPFEKKEVHLSAIEIKNPRLWWPNTYGPQNLYRSVISFVKDDQEISDSRNIEVGLREVRNNWNMHTRSMEVRVNGQLVFIRGGNWIVSDALLRFSNARYDAEVRFHRDMGLNLIRVWGGALTERPEFYEACDRYGLLVMQDFWGSGDCNGRWMDPKKKEDQWTRRQYPDDHQLFIRSAADMIRMIRNYPSLAIWCGGNEIVLPPDIFHALKDSLMPVLDGTRWFIDYSNSDSMSYNATGGNGDGPYGIQPLSYFWNYRTWPFNSEIGSVGMGDLVSLQRFLPKANQVIPSEQKGSEAVNDSVWTYHKYIGYGRFVNAYGMPRDLEDFANKAQLVNYDQYRSLTEGFIGHQWDWYTGVIIWKTQNPWTALRGQMYDYYLDPNACLYGLRTGNRPLHGMFSFGDSSVYIANNTWEKKDNLMLVVKTYDMQGKEHLITQVFCEAIPQNSKRIFSLNSALSRVAKQEGTFLAIQLLDADKTMIDENIYWLPDATGQYSGLNNMPPSRLTMHCRKLAEGKAEVTLTNPYDAPVAFFNRLSVVDPKTGERLLPGFYSDNYVTLLPGSQKKITIDYPETASGISVSVSGWNLKEQRQKVRP